MVGFQLYWMVLKYIFGLHHQTLSSGTGALRFDELLMAFSMSMRGTGHLGKGFSSYFKNIVFSQLKD